jgi:hypothetical protein
MSWGQGDSWAAQKTRKQVLNDNKHDNQGLCRLAFPCCTGQATEVHHKDGLQGRPRHEATDPNECIAVCRPCHRLVTEQQRMAAWRADQDRRRARRHLPTRPHPGA